MERKPVALNAGTIGHIYGINSSSQFCGGSTYTFYTDPNPSGTYHWAVHGGDILSGQGTSYIQVRIWDAYGTEPYPFYVSVQTTDDCGEPTQFNADASYINCNGAPGDPTLFPYRVFPNPVSSVFEIVPNNIHHSGLLTAVINPYSVQLYNKDQVLVYQSLSLKDKTTVEVANLPKGLYYLVIKDSTGEYKRQMIVE